VGRSETVDVAASLRAVVSLAALRWNLDRVRQRLAPGTELIACVKANAYGHGLLPVAACLQAAGVRWLSLGNPAGALALRAAGITCDVLLFPTAEGADHAPLAAAGITVGVQSFDEAAALARTDGASPAAIFLKVDSGLGRVGVPLHDAARLAARIRAALPRVRLAGLFTHLPFRGEEALPWVEERLASFGHVVAEIRRETPGPLLAQALASEGIARGVKAPEANAVCPGSLLYGLEPAGLPAPLGTRPVLVEVSTVLGALREIAPSTRYGHGGGRVAARASRLGALPIGYSNSILVPKAGQRVRIDGCEAPVLSVSLEHAVVDVTDVAGARAGAPVCLVTGHAGAGPTLADVAAAQGRTALEILVSLTGRAAYEYSGSETAPAGSMPS
jgi:alanine racemase